MKAATAVSACVFVFAIGCGSNGSNSGDDVAVDASVGVDGPAAGFSDLIGRDWDVPAGSADTYKCTRIKVTEDMYISGFHAIAPVGTHHTVVTIGSQATPLGDFDCSVGTIDFQMLFASGVGTDDLMFPDGVAMKIKAGQFINLNLHLFNATDAAITGHSGIQVKRVAQADVVHEADMTFAGTMNIDIPSDGQPHDSTGGCKVPAGGWHVFNLWPHMHQHATHQKFEVTLAGGTKMALIDDAYSFAEQTNYPMVDTFFPAGTDMLTTCTYVNTTGVTLRFGDSSNQEMCFTGMYKYPAGGNPFQCAGF
ncbi:MAG: hypothetical protein H6Q90_240 [Deltaproteobacteria bacterium]|nr:hypothetical protein [Deltaproteobacteria bacterium]